MNKTYTVCSSGLSDDFVGLQNHYLVKDFCIHRMRVLSVVSRISHCGRIFLEVALEFSTLCDFTIFFCWKTFKFKTKKHSSKKIVKAHVDKNSNATSEKFCLNVWCILYTIHIHFMLYPFKNSKCTIQTKMFNARVEIAMNF